MQFKATRIPYHQTNAFSPIALDYLSGATALKPFYESPPTLEGIKQAIERRKAFNTPRELLVQELKNQYQQESISEKTRANIEALLSPECFTITTAHQNNIFTGPLYFIYKILHVIKIAEELKAVFPHNHFVPVYYIGSEDADLAELNHIYLDGEKLVWETAQKGAVGRMNVDKAVLKLIERIEGQLAVLPFGKEMVILLKECYREGVAIERATFCFVNRLFSSYGLVVLMPDNKVLKKEMQKVFEDDLLHETASGIVLKTAESLGNAGYKVQANPREINLFYLVDDIRERIERRGDEYFVNGSSLRFSKEEMLKELEEHPDRFSPNVILRGLYQETILPDIAFVGGPGETAYWLQLKDLFHHYKIPFPVLVQRNSFMIVDKNNREKIAKLQLTVKDLFGTEQELMNKIVERDSQHDLKLNGSLPQVEHLYEQFKDQASVIDTTLTRHVEALKMQALHRLQELEKKMLRAEKRKFTDQQRQLQTLRQSLFPRGGLQERIENFMSFYARWGNDFLQMLYKNSLGLEQEFVVVEEE